MADTPHPRRSATVATIATRVIAYFALAWGTIAVLAAGLFPGALAVAIIFALYMTAPLIAFLLWRGWPFYPGAAFRLLVVRPFWYTQLMLPLVAAGGIIGALIGLPFGHALDAGRATAAVVFAVAAIILALGYIGSRKLVVRQVDLDVPRLPRDFEGLRIAQLSDLHIGPHTPRRFLERVVQTTSALAPDLVAVTGDLIDDRAEDVAVYSRMLGAMEAPLGVYMIPGNHDVYAGWDDVERALRLANIGTVLVNEATEVRRGASSIALVGTGDPAGGRRGTSRAAPDIERALANVAPDATVIAFAHNPALWPSLAKRGVALTLSGHTHWGQFALPKLGWSLASPFLEHAMGAHQESDSLLYISPGTGYWGIPFRIGASPEITLLTLRSASSAAATVHRPRTARRALTQLTTARGALAVAAIATALVASDATAQRAAQIGTQSSAQSSASLYQPRAIKNTYTKGTRSPDGRPGAKYWQNHGRYTITVTASPPDRTIRGTEQIVYTNNSPDTLKQLVTKLFLNVRKPGAPRDAGVSPGYLNEGVHIDGFMVNGQAGAWRDDPRFFTWQPFALPAPLMPHDSVRLSFDWHYEISKEAGREGMLDSTTFYLAYFYPRIAVYDDYNGWDTMNFTDAQEFYSDFNDYDVTLRVPANYIVWGTGTLTNLDQVLQPTYAQRFKSSLTSDAVVHVATAADLATKQVTIQGATNAWHFATTNIPDVTFAISDHYVWDAASVVVDDATHRRAGVQSAFNDTAADFHHMVEFGRHSLDWLSHNWPGIPYPYEKTTIVQGSADMEYPMMVNDSPNADTTFSRFVAEHEIAHTYFPFYMGINETRYAFMDEGWATTFEYLIGVADMGKAKEDEFYKQFRVTGWATDPSPSEDLPIITPEDVLKSQAWGNNAYGKASIGYLAMKDMLGDALFRKSLHTFMDRWHGKHPIPWDFFNTFNDVTGQNLNWFWNAWYFSNGYVDLGVSDVTKASGAYTFVLDNIGGMPAPVDIVLHFTDGSTQTLHQTSKIWEANIKQATVRVSAAKTIQSVDLDTGIWVDAAPANNHWTAPTKRS